MANDPFLKNTVSVGLNNIWLNVFGFISSILVARALGPSGQGIVALIMLIPAILSKFISLGTQASASYFINSGRYKVEQVSSNVIITSVVVSILVGAGVVLFYNPSYLQGYYFGLSGRYFISLFIAIYLVLNFVRVNMIGLFYSLEKYSLSNKFNLINEVVPVTFFLLLFVTKIFSVEWVFVGYLLTSLIGLVLIIIDFRKHKIPFKLSFDLILFKKFLVYGLPVYYNSVAQTLSQRISLFFIAGYLDMASVGYFSIAYSTAERLNELSKPIVVTHFPRAIQISSQKDKSQISSFTSSILAKLSALYAVCLVPFVILIAIFIPIFYSHSYQPSVALAIILSFGIVALGRTKILNNMYAAAGRQLTNAFILTTSLAVNTLLILAFLKLKMGLSGVALASVISYTLTLFLQIFVARKRFELKIPYIAFDFKGLFGLAKKLVKKNV